MKNRIRIGASRAPGIVQSLASSVRLPTPWAESGRGDEPRFALYRGDCREILDSFPAGCIDCIVADPPYLLSNGGSTVRGGRRVSVDKGSWDRSAGVVTDGAFHLGWIAACRRVLKPSGTLWVSGTYHSVFQCGVRLAELGFHVLNDIVWFKPNAAPNLGCRVFTASHETLLWARREKSTRHTFHYERMKHGRWPGDFLKHQGRQMRSVWEISPPGRSETRFGRHPTQKPLELLRRILLASTNEGDVVIDPFLGSGTTGVAARLLGRRFIGVEREKGFLELALRRLRAALTVQPPSSQGALVSVAGDRQGRRMA